MTHRMIDDREFDRNIRRLLHLAAIETADDLQNRIEQTARAVCGKPEARREREEKRNSVRDDT